MKVYVTRENPRLNCSLDDATLLDIVRLLNAKANLGSASTEIVQDLAGHKENNIMIREKFPIDAQYVIKQNGQRVSFGRIIGDCIRIPCHGKRLFLSCDNHNEQFLVLVHRPGYRFPYIPYKIYVAYLSNTALRIKERLGRFTKIGDI